MSESTLENTEGRQKQDKLLAATITTYYHSALSTVSIMLFLAIHRETAVYVNTSIKGKRFHKSLEETSPCACTPTPKHHSSCLPIQGLTANTYSWNCNLPLACSLLGGHQYYCIIFRLPSTSFGQLSINTVTKCTTAFSAVSLPTSAFLLFSTYLKSNPKRLVDLVTQIQPK